MFDLTGKCNVYKYILPQTYIVKPFATIPKDLSLSGWYWLIGGTFDSATGGTFKVLQSTDTHVEGIVEWLES